MHSQHHRFAIWSAVQHPYKHSASEFLYTNPAFPGASNIEQAMNWVAAVLYPQTQASVANVAALPSGGNTINDYRVVLDDGDGKAASYRWEQREGDVAAQWYKIYDMDWGADSILEQYLTRTQGLYAFKGGTDDLDYTGAAITGTLAGQQIFGGKSASTNLTLSANSGDGVGANTGYVQFTDTIRPTTDNARDVGTSALKFRTGYFGTSLIVAADLTIASGSITSASGAISFDNENLSTTGNISAAIVTATSHVKTNIYKSSADYTRIDLANSYLYDPTGTNVVAIFDDIRFTVMKGIRFYADDVGSAIILKNVAVGSSSFTLILPAAQGGVGTFMQNDGSGTLSWANAVTTLSAIGATPNANGASITSNTLNLQPADASFGGVVTTGTQTMAGAKTFSTSVAGGNVQLASNTISTTNANGDLSLTPNGSGTIIASAILKAGGDNTIDLGLTGTRWRTLYVGTSISDGTNAILSDELLALRNVKFRDAARLSAVQNGDALFYDSASGTWLASVPDTEVAHAAISGLTTSDAGHTQFAMLAGRSGGQTIQGGTAGGEHLLLESTANASKGSIKFKDNLIPNTTAAFSAGWTGTDVGGASNLINNIYSAGEHKGLRFENYTTAGMPSFSAQKIGRMYFDTDLGLIKYDTGAAIKTVPLTPTLATAAKTAAYTTVSTDNFIKFDMSGSSNASYAVTLHTAVGNTGQILFFEITAGTGTLSVNTTSSQTVGTLNSGVWAFFGVANAMSVVSDGTNWQVLNRPFITPKITRYTSGSGTFTTQVGPTQIPAKYIVVTAVGGGGGGSGTLTPFNSGSDGAASTVTGILSAGGGYGSAGGGAGARGTTTLTAGTILWAVDGGTGASCFGHGAGVGYGYNHGGYGGCTSFGGGVSTYNGTGPAGGVNTGAGGGGGGTGATASAGGGGGGGAGSLCVYISSPAASYAYSVGAGGAGGAANGDGYAGGAGAAGQIVFEEHF